MIKFDVTAQVASVYLPWQLQTLQDTKNIRALHVNALTEVQPEHPHINVKILILMFNRLRTK